MKRLLYITLAVFACVVVTTTNAQSLWDWEYPDPQGNTLYDVDVMPPTRAVAVGVLGAVVTSLDGGVTWTALPAIAGTPTLFGVAYVDATTIVAVGAGGTIVRTSDSGMTWSAIAIGTTTSLLDVDFADASNGMAVGGAGTILRSTDGGATWSAQTSGTSSALRSVSVVNALTATAVGQGGTILNTVDGGTTWTAQTSGTTQFLFGVDFADANTGTAVGWGSMLGATALGTTDGGATWSPLTLPGFTPPDLLAVSMSDATHIFSVGEDPNLPLGPVGVLARSADGGTSWNVDGEPGVLNGVAMFDNTTGIAVGAAGLIRRTTDGGVAWPQVGGGEQRYGMSALDFFGTQNGVAVSFDQSGTNLPSSRAYVTNNGGNTWSVSSPFPGGTTFDVAFADASTVYAVGNGPVSMDGGATIWRSDDSGATWGQVFSTCCPPCGVSCIQSLHAVDFADPTAGVAVGTFGGIVTIIGGVFTWESLPTMELLNGVSVSSTSTAYAVGNNGTILKGDLGSALWVAQASGTTAILNDVCFTDDNTGTAVGASGTILRTTDGGASWVLQASGTTAFLTSCSFLDANTGVVTGGSTLFKTVDGGTTWVSEPMPSNGVDVVLIDLVNVRVVGGDENIISRTDVPVPVFFQDVVAEARPHSVELRWGVYADEVIRGFRVYRSDDGAPEVVVSNGMIAPTERSFLDENVVSGVIYGYTLAAVGEDGFETRSQSLRVELAPATATLFQNHPNPFNPTTRIRFTLPVSMQVSLRVYDVAGHRVATLVDAERPAGNNFVTWNGKNDSGDPAATGIYFYELRTRDGVTTRKMALLK